MEGTIGIWMSAWMLMHSGISATTTFQSRLQMLVKKARQQESAVGSGARMHEYMAGTCDGNPLAGVSMDVHPFTWAGGSCLQ